MVIQIHPEATRNFNARANELFLRLKKRRRSVLYQGSGRAPRDWPTALIQPSDIIDGVHISALVNFLGDKTARTFGVGEDIYGFFEDDYSAFVNLVDQIQRTIELRDSVSKSFVADCILKWAELRVTGQQTPDVVEYLVGRCENEIKSLEVWIPIAETVIDSQFDIGKVTFKAVTRSMIDDWLENDKAENKAKSLPFSEEDIELSYQKMRKNIQGRAAATMNLLAEPSRAVEIAYDESIKSIGLLRLFSPAMLLPRARSFTTPVGFENLGVKEHFTLSESRLLGFSWEGVYQGNPTWHISDETLEAMRMGGLLIVDKLAREASPSEFQASLLNSLLLYSESCLSDDIKDRLVYVLAALESMLIADASEPIQSSLADRMAFFMGEDRDHRLKIVENVRDVYSLRSQFLHHGKSIKDWEAIGAFLLNAWAFFVMTIGRAYEFHTKPDFIRHIQDIKYSG